jgi:hypothetical protein
MVDMGGSLPFDEQKGCPPGFHKRNSYTSKLGHRVPPRCVKAQTVYAESRKNFTQRMQHKMNARLEAVGKSPEKTLHCPPGQVSRKGYVRRFGISVMQKGYTVKKHSGKPYHIKPGKKSVYVKPSCVKDRGDPKVKAPASDKVVGYLRKGELKKHGYVYVKSREERHVALKKAIQEFGPLGVYHKLDIIAKLSKYRVPRAADIFKEDRDWVRSHYELRM